MQIISPNFGDIFQPNIEIGTFPDGDSHVRIPQITRVKGQEIVVFHRLYPEQNVSLVVLFLILDALKQEGAKVVNVVVPYMPYARQDKKKLDGEVQSAYVVCNMLARAGCSKLITFDCHFLKQEGLAKFGELNIENISMAPDLVDLVRKEAFNGEDFEIISPDMGANYMVTKYGGKSYQKVRKDYDGTKIHYRDVHEMDGDFKVKDRNVLLLDDMISSGNTMFKALEKLNEAGAKKVCCAATHGLFLFNCIDKMRQLADCIFATDTIVNPLSKVSIKEKLLKI